MSSDLIKIKDKYGEKMMHLCRELFPTILETEGLLFTLLSLHFNYSKFLYEDIDKHSLKDNFKDYIYGLLESKEDLVFVDKTPVQLLNEVGYDLYECKTEEDVQKFIGYYKTNERLCTFRGGRLFKCHVFFAVKKNALNINREDYLIPLRQDAYGTSVISIQFTRGNVNTLSIKNRYNHTVHDPDATYSNNLENIIPGLTKSFEREYNLNINQSENFELQLPGYVRASNGKYYKYNYEINNVYYCADNIIIDNFNVINHYSEKEKYIIMDYFIVDLVNKKISLYDKKINDSFINDLDNIKKIEILKVKSTGNRILNITFNDLTKAIIEIDNCNRMVSYTNENITMIGDNFLANNIYMDKIELFNVTSIGNYFMSCNTMLSEIDISNVSMIGVNFLFLNRLLTSLDVPSLIEVKDNFLYENRILNNINAFKLARVGNNFLYNNLELRTITLNSLISVGDYFLNENRILNEINCSNLVNVGNYFLQYNMELEYVSLENLVKVGRRFICANKIIKYLNLPKLMIVKDSFLYCNRELRFLVLNNLQVVGDNFLYSNKVLEDVCLFELRYVGCKFLYNNNSLLRLELLSLMSVGGYFLYNNKCLIELYAPNLAMVGNCFLSQNNVLKIIEMFSLNDYGNNFLNNSLDIKKRVLNLSS